jgi:response regulator RpfG family c-di-GMP phosphodiesterase
MIIEESGSHFDPVLVDAFIQCEDDFKQIGQRFAEYDWVYS